MPRLAAAERAKVLLAEGRLVVTFAKAEVVAADVRGSGAVHRVEHRPDSGWSCTCEAGRYRRLCAHVEAAKLVTAPIRGAR